jgi:hypothetical protein
VTILAPRPSGHAFSHRADEKGPKTLRGHRELILNYFRAKKMFSSGRVPQHRAKNQREPETVCRVKLNWPSAKQQQPGHAPVDALLDVPDRGLRLAAETHELPSPAAMTRRR